MPRASIEYARLINESGRHLLSVVNGILDMSKMETGNFEITPEPFEPAPPIRQLLRPPGAEGARGRRRDQDAGARRSARSRRRPARAQPDPDQPHFQRHQVHPARRQRHRRRERDGERLAISVDDTGVGIGEDDLQRVGEAFFQARASYDRRHDGSGLGLSIVKGLVRLHGGDMEIHSRLGAGTSVTVRLPLDGTGAQPRRRSGQAGDRARRGNDGDPQIQVKKSA